MTARIWRDASGWARPKTPSGGVTRGSRTSARRAQPPAITDTAWWIAFALLGLAAISALHLLAH